VLAKGEVKKRVLGPTSNRENNSKHRKKTGKYPETTPTNHSSKTVAIHQ
jgi:hypothetical protein